MVEMMSRKKEMLDRVFTIEPTPRVERLRQRVLQSRPTVEIDKARIQTKVMKQTEGEPMVTRIAKAFAAVVRGMPIRIFPDELIVGFEASSPRAIPARPESGADLEVELDILGTRPQDPLFVSEEDKKVLREEIFPYWRGQGKYEGTVQGRTYLDFPPETANLLFVDPEQYPTVGTSIIDVDYLRTIGEPNHSTVNFEKVLEKGFLGIKKDAEERLARVDYDDPDEVRKVPFLKGVIMAMEAAAGVGKRFAGKAREMAEEEEDAKRKADLLKIAEVCDWVPANPARTFWEALQTTWFTHILCGWELSKNLIAMSPGRVDQYLYPYYEGDIREGRITKEEAQELLDCWLLKFALTISLLSSSAARYSAGFGVAQQMTVGGLKADGSDATNELSYMLIEATMHTRLPQPTMAVRMHSNTPEELLIKACQLASLGTGHPSFFNDDVIVPSVLARGNLGGPPVTLELARTCSIIGCVEPQIAGKEGGYTAGGHHNIAAALEFALNNGVSRVYNRKMGVETGDPRKFKTFEELREAYKKQVAWLVRNHSIAHTVCELALAELTPSVYVSSIIEDCIEKGMPREAGGARYNFGPGPLGVGVADVADSLTAIKKLVFEDKKITMEQLCDALDKNFEGYEGLRQMLLNAPKYGNDSGYADEQASWACHVFAEEVKKHRNTRGGYKIAGIVPVAAFVPLGLALGALPSGRLARTPLADGCSPSHGNDLKGPTAVLKSVGTINHAELTNGTQLNMRVDPAVFKNEDGVKRLAAMMRTFVDLKVWHTQFNVVSSSVLRAAQKEPGKYRDLVVKVAGYNAFFVELHKDIQDDIIARTEYEL